MAGSVREFDVIVIGSGPIGQTLADKVRAGGLTVAVVERELVGGECSYWACIPSKAMLRPVVAVTEAQHVDGAREAVTGPIDAESVFARRDRYVTSLDDTGQANWVKSIGATLVRGHGRLEGPRRVAVTTPDDEVVVLTARHAVAICTGSLAAMPDVPGIAEARPWTNRRGTDSSNVPARLAIVGGGPVGVELATAWNGLGSTVTLFDREQRLLPRMEPFAGELVAEGLTEAGVTVRTEVTLESLRRPVADGPVTVTLDDGSKHEVDEVLFAIGRTPLTGDIGLETVDLPAGSWLDVDDTCRVRGADGWLFALGDVNHRALLTHQGKYQARIAAQVILDQAAGNSVDDATPWGVHVASADRSAVPQVVFTSPEAAAVGRTAEEAAAEGYRFMVVDVDLGAKVAGANLYADGYRGQARMIVDEDTRCLLGVTFVGAGVTELLHSATIAIVGQIPIERLWHAVPSFPTISETWLRLLEAYQN
ncbi:NAD(P)/FAD-dependent oxidoreductase [Kribbella sp. NBC_00662]|uniref:dihydrolipoyl dehydrogenase family protein n=1 Tax=Kribbella sp. NBC_00662 TaxID=2975969 RepID=UPI003251613C